MAKQITRHTDTLQEKAKQCTVHPQGNGLFLVDSPSGKHYFVRAMQDGGFTCLCDWGKYHDTTRDPCSHVMAVEIYLANAGLRKPSFWNNQEDAQKQHRPTLQFGRGVWATYRKAGT